MSLPTADTPWSLASSSSSSSSSACCMVVTSNGFESVLPRVVVFVKRTDNDDVAVCVPYFILVCVIHNIVAVAPVAERFSHRYPMPKIGLAPSTRCVRAGGRFRAKIHLLP